jgi:hypothetical protein
MFNPSRIQLALAALLAVGAMQAPALANPTHGTLPTAAQKLSAINIGAPRLSPDLMHPDKKTKYPVCGVQFTYTLSPYQDALFFTFGWPQGSYIEWTAMNDTANSSGPVVSLTNVATQNTGSSEVTYWLTIDNETGAYQAIEGRYCFLQ